MKAEINRFRAMKGLSLLSYFLSILAMSKCQSRIRERLIELPVDHFNVLNRDTFNARYYVNDQHWYPGGVIFVYINSGFELYDDFLISGTMFELAEETNSYLFSMEQRFFGQSQPFDDFSTENLRYLTIHQSVADIAAFINFIRENYYGARNSRVILWGRGYGGSLAIWARQKYPHMVDAVWASSAPIETNFEYPQLFTNLFHTFNSIGGSECGDVITGAFKTIEDAIRARNLTHVETRLNSCFPIDVELEEEVNFLPFYIASNMADSFMLFTTYTGVDDACTIMRGLNTPENLPESDFEGFARWYVDDLMAEAPCNVFSRRFIIDLIRNIEIQPGVGTFGLRPLIWIYCTQLGNFPIANEGNGHPFGWRFDRKFLMSYCIDIFDSETFALTEQIMMEMFEEKQTSFGGLNPNVNRVFFTQGEMDPYHNLGPNEDLNEKAPVVVMSLQSWGRDFGSPSETDYVVLQETKARARELMIEWIFDAIGEQPTPSPPVSPLNDINKV